MRRVSLLVLFSLLVFLGSCVEPNQKEQQPDTSAPTAAATADSSQQEGEPVNRAEDKPDDEEETVEVEKTPSEPLYFHGYRCKDDCSGHEAGYEWAEENDISDEDDCDGNSESFIEGCKAYVEENH